jgi:chaperone BCS1
VKTYDNFFYEKKAELFEQIENIKNSKAEYERVGKPYQINILIYGEDFGCGKTSLLKLLCKMFGNDEKKRHIINLNLAKIKTCSELEDIFLCNDEILGQKIENDERIYIIDEIDKVSDVLYKDDCKDDDCLVEIVKRDMKSFINTLDKEKGNKLKDLLETAGDFSPKKQSTSDDSLNLGFILSLIDGPIEYHDRIMIFTANNIDKLHPALLRSGRIDLKINLKKATKTIIRQIVSHIFLWEGEFSEKIEKMIESIPDYKYSQSDIFTECLNNKKHKYTNDKEKEEDIIKVFKELFTHTT